MIKHTTRYAQTLLASLALIVGLTMILPYSGAAYADEAEAEQAKVPNLDEQIQLAATQLLTATGGTSLRYALVEDGQVTLEGGAGTFSREQAKLPGADALYGIGSVSKMYTTAAVMQLVDAGKVKLDAPVTDYVKDFTMADDRYKQITVRMLLNHSSGLYGSSFGNTFLFDGTGTEGKDHLLASLATQVLKADPGAYSVYANDGFTLAEILVERVSGKSFTDYIHENLLAPLELTNTFTPVDSFDKERLAKIYHSADAAVALPNETVGVIGTGGIYATAADLAHFGEAFYRGGVLSESSRTAMRQPEYKKGFWTEEEMPTTSYGLGFDNVSLFPFSRSDITALVKGGDTLFYHTSLIVLPEYKMSVAVTSSGGLSLTDEMIASTILITKLAERGVTVDTQSPVFPAAKVATPSQAELAKAGVYVAGASKFTVNITKEGLLSLAEQPGYSYQYYTDGSYRDEAGTISLKLVERSGQTYFLQQQLSTIPGFAPLFMSDYAGHKMPVNPVADSATKAWMEQNGQLFVLVSEPYNSQYYITGQAAMILQVDEQNNYVLGNKIVDEQTATPVTQLPGMGGRDWNDYRLFTDEGTNYLKTGEFTFVRADSLKPITKGGNAVATIGAKGDARWYTTGEAAGKLLSVTVPDNGSFIVYDKNWQIVASSLLGDKTVIVPEDGMIVFAGAAGNQFKVSVKAAPAAIPAPAQAPAGAALAEAAPAQ
jgi:CubicO group peptidase (beta-lactamase class C family)